MVAMADAAEGAAADAAEVAVLVEAAVLRGETLLGTQGLTGDPPRGDPAPVQVRHTGTVCPFGKARDALLGTRHKLLGQTHLGSLLRAA